MSYLRPFWEKLNLSKVYISFGCSTWVGLRPQNDKKIE